MPNLQTNALEPGGKESVEFDPLSVRTGEQERSKEQASQPLRVLIPPCKVPSSFPQHIEHAQVTSHLSNDPLTDAPARSNLPYIDPVSPSQSSDDAEMRRQKKALDDRSSGWPPSFGSPTTTTNGHIIDGSIRSSHMDLRRKNSSVDSTSSVSPAADLIARETFSLDSEPPGTPHTPVYSDNSFWELPRRDRRNFVLLVMLYFLQGIPMGLAAGSVPLLLKKAHFSYSQMGVFSLASYPYSLKLLWSPIVDAVWSPRIGRRKSWIIPIQMLSGIGMNWLGARVKGMMTDAGAEQGSGIWPFTGWWFFLVLMCATQDIAVDGEPTKKIGWLNGPRLDRHLVPARTCSLSLRLGVDAPIASEHFLCIYGANRRPHRRSVLILYRLSCFQFA